MTRLLDEMSDTKYRIAEITRGYETSEYSHPTRDHSGLRLDSGTVIPAVGMSNEKRLHHLDEAVRLLREASVKMSEIGLRLDVVLSDHLTTNVELYAERNGELHVLCRTLLDKYRAAVPDDPWVYEVDAIICNVPQARLKREK